MSERNTPLYVSRDQNLRHARGQGNIHFPCSADHEQDWQPYPVDPYSAICDDHTYIHTYILYNYIDRHTGTPDKTKTKRTISLDYSSICYIASRIVVAGVQLNFMWCGVGKTNQNDEPYIKLVMFVFL